MNEEKRDFPFENYISINKQFLDVRHFNANILGIKRRTPGLQVEDEFKLSMHQLKEEIGEIEEAYSRGDFIAVLDGLIDLEYFLLGIFYKNGINESAHAELFEVVHEANMLKRAGVKAGREGYDATDAIKPDSWTNPEIKIARILDKVNRRGS
jgi:predicted HAD superfamily Cof-like phosphohydrolase